MLPGLEKFRSLMTRKLKIWVSLLLNRCWRGKKRACEISEWVKEMLFLNLEIHLCWKWLELDPQVDNNIYECGIPKKQKKHIKSDFLNFSFKTLPSLIYKQQVRPWTPSYDFSNKYLHDTNCPLVHFSYTDLTVISEAVLTFSSLIQASVHITCLL